MKYSLCYVKLLWNHYVTLPDLGYIWFIELNWSLTDIYTHRGIQWLVKTSQRTPDLTVFLTDLKKEKKWTATVTNTPSLTYSILKESSCRATRSKRKLTWIFLLSLLRQCPDQEPETYWTNSSPTGPPSVFCSARTRLYYRERAWRVWWRNRASRELCYKTYREQNYK